MQHGDATKMNNIQHKNSLCQTSMINLIYFMKCDKTEQEEDQLIQLGS